MRPFLIRLSDVKRFEHDHSGLSLTAHHDQPRNTMAGSSDLTLRKETIEADRQRTWVATKARAAIDGVTDIFMSSLTRSVASPRVSASPMAKPRTAANIACSAINPQTSMSLPP